DAAGRGKAGKVLVLAGQRTFLREQLIADAHLHVVGLAGEDLQRLVLRLPAEAADRSVVAVVIESPGHADVVILLVVEVREQRRIVDVLHQTGAEGRRRDAEDYVVRLDGPIEAGLRNAGSGRAGATRRSVDTSDDRVEIFHAAIRPVRIGVAVAIEEEREAGL